MNSKKALKKDKKKLHLTVEFIDNMIATMLMATIVETIGYKSE